MASVKEKRRGDPTRTTRLRKNFAAELAARMRVIRSAIWQAIVVDDVFGFGGGVVTNKRKKEASTKIKKPTPGQFAFPTDADKVAAFNRWLREQIDAGVLGVTQRAGHTVTGDSWMNTYIDSAYKKAVVQARLNLAKAGIQAAAITGVGDLAGTLALMQPVHADTVKLLYTRSFEDLQGITGAMATQISRELAQGLAQGDNPRAIARALVDRVDAIGVTRARTLARTEISRAHAEGTLNEYDRYKVQGVTLQVEFHTAADPCPVCAETRDEFDGPIPLSQARGVIPVHPNCRCVWLPADVGESADEHNLNRGKVAA